MHRILTGPLTVENRTIAIADLPASWHGIKLVQLSDFHYDGLRLSEDLLAEAIATSNQLEPDLVVLTGDYVTDDPAPIHQLVLRLKHLQSRAGIYAILGNHDLYYRRSKSEISTALTSVGIRVLWNEIAYPLGSKLALVGLADFWSREFNPAPVLSQIDPKIPRIVLSHNPDSIQNLSAWRVDLQLSGHTHGGQIVLPGMGPVLQWLSLKTFRNTIPTSVRPWLPFLQQDGHKAVHHWEWSEGLHQVGNHQLYINRGLGTYLPGRLFCPPEVTAIQLVAQATKKEQSS